MEWKVTEDTRCLSLARVHPHTHEYVHSLRKSNCKRKRLQQKSLQLFSCAQESAFLTELLCNSGQPARLVLLVGQVLPAVQQAGVGVLGTWPSFFLRERCVHGTLEPWWGNLCFRKTLHRHLVPFLSPGYVISHLLKVTQIMAQC